jgi:hypothetical protein
MTLKSDLTAARALIDTPEKWTQHNPSAVTNTYCIVTATALGRSYANAARANLALHCTAALRGREIMDNLINFNDDPATTHADVLRLFDRAIAAAGDA